MARRWFLASIACAGSALHPATGAPRPPQPPKGEIVVDMADPVITTTIGGVSLRLRVDPEAKDVVQLNPEAARRTGVALTRPIEAVVGRVTVAGRAGPATLVVAGRSTPVIVAAHDRPCCTGVDGEIAPLLLPFGTVRFERSAAIPHAMERRWPLQASGETGQFVRQRTPAGTLFVQFSLIHAETLATAASGAMLAQAGGGRFVGQGVQVARAFGVERPAMRLALAHPVPVAGFAIDGLLVRQADFRGGHRLPRARAEPGDIAVSGRAPPGQSAWPALSIGRDRLDRCDRIAITRQPAEIMLRCAD